MSRVIFRVTVCCLGNRHRGAERASSLYAEALINLNVVPSKTFKEVIPNIKEEMLPHFIRGFFDGDGIACRTEKTYSFGFVGNKIILDQLKNILEWNNSLNPHVITNGIYTLLTSDKKKLLKFYHYIYDDSTFCLERKRKKLESIF